MVFFVEFFFAIVFRAWEGRIDPAGEDDPFAPLVLFADHGYQMRAKFFLKFRGAWLFAVDDTIGRAESLAGSVLGELTLREPIKRMVSPDGPGKVLMWHRSIVTNEGEMIIGKLFFYGLSFSMMRLPC